MKRVLTLAAISVLLSVTSALSGRGLLPFEPRGAQAARPAISFDWEKAVSLYIQGQFRAAIAEFQNVVAEFPNHADSWKYIGLAYYQLKEYQPAVAPLEKALVLKNAEGKVDPEIMIALGRIQIALKQYDKAIPYLEATIKQQPQSAANFYMLGVSYANLNRTDDAIAALREAVKLDPKDDDSWYYLGILHFRTNDLERAIPALRNGVAVAPQNAEMMSLLVEALLRRGAVEANEQKANAFYEEAIKTATSLKALRDDAVSAELLGRAYLAAQKYPRAEEALARALELTQQPTAALYFNLGYASAQNKSWARAAEVLEKADKLNPGDVNTLTYLGFVYESMRRYQQALEAYSRAYEASGGNNAELKASMERVRPFAKP
jgi:tetratricopeptide (TPR) repeat protein